MIARDFWPLKSLHRYISHLKFVDTLDLLRHVFPLIEEANYRSSFVANVWIAWINSRCTSFCLDTIWSEDLRKRPMSTQMLHFSAYVFYLPVSVMGPIVNYDAFKEGVIANIW